MMKTIKMIIKLHSPHPVPPLFVFEMALKVTEKKSLVLKSFNLNVKRALEVQAKSPMGYRSEFRKGEILLPLLQNHPLWPRLKNLLCCNGNVSW
jgi:hypothetical protein